MDRRPFFEDYWYLLFTITQPEVDPKIAVPLAHALMENAIAAGKLAAALQYEGPSPVGLKIEADKS